MTTYKVKNEWLVDAEGKTVYKPLEFWVNYFKAVEVKGHQGIYKANTKSGFVDMQGDGGYGIYQEDFEKYKGRLFFVGNADLDRPVIRLVRN